MTEHVQLVAAFQRALEIGEDEMKVGRADRARNLNQRFASLDARADHARGNLSRQIEKWRNSIKKNIYKK